MFIPTEGTHKGNFVPNQRSQTVAQHNHNQQLQPEALQLLPVPHLPPQHFSQHNAMATTGPPAMYGQHQLRPLLQTQFAPQQFAPQHLIYPQAQYHPGSYLPILQPQNVMQFSVLPPAVAPTAHPPPHIRPPFPNPMAFAQPRRAKDRKHALAIIDPITKENIMDSWQGGTSPEPQTSQSPLPVMSPTRRSPEVEQPPPTESEQVERQIPECHIQSQTFSAASSAEKHEKIRTVVDYQMQTDQIEHAGVCQNFSKDKADVTPKETCDQIVQTNSVNVQNCQESKETKEPKDEDYLHKVVTELDVVRCLLLLKPKPQRLCFANKQRQKQNLLNAVVATVTAINKEEDKVIEDVSASSTSHSLSQSPLVGDDSDHIDNDKSLYSEILKVKENKASSHPRRKKNYNRKSNRKSDRNLTKVEVDHNQNTCKDLKQMVITEVKAPEAKVVADTKKNKITIEIEKTDETEPPKVPSQVPVEQEQKIVEEIIETKELIAKEPPVYKYSISELKELRKCPMSNHAMQLGDSKGSKWYKIYCEIVANAEPHGGHGGNHMNNRRNNKSRKSQSLMADKKPDNIIHVRLSLHEEVKLNETSDAWKPSMIQPANGKPVDSTAQLVKRVMGILNRLTPENFDVLLRDAVNFKIDSEEVIKKIMVVIFEKAIAEPNFSPTYAKFCQTLFKDNRQNQQSNSMFITVLIQHTQQEFSSNVNNENAINSKLKPILQKIAESTDAEEKESLKIDLETEEFLFRRRAWGTVRLIGELFNLNILSGNIINQCLTTLLDPHCEEKLEYFCKLLSTVGKRFEKTPYARSSRTYSDELNLMMPKAHDIANRKAEKSQKPLSNRVRFMLLDIIDLRHNNWNVNAPKTITKFPPLPEPTARPDVKKKPPIEKHPDIAGNLCKKMPVKLDLQKLQIDQNTSMQMGSRSQFNWHSKLGAQKSTPAPKAPTPPPRSPTPPPPPPVIEEIDNVKFFDQIVDALICQDDAATKECERIWRTAPKKQHPDLVCFLLADYIFLRHVKELERSICAEALVHLVKQKLLLLSDFLAGYQQMAEIVGYLIEDVKTIWEDMFYLLGPLIADEVIKLDMIWVKSWRNTDMAAKFVKGFIEYFTTEHGPSYMRALWKKLDLKWTTFYENSKVPAFLRSKGYEFVKNPNHRAPVFKQKDAHEVCLRAKRMLTEAKPLDAILDYLAGNVRNDVDSTFIRYLTKTLCDYFVIDEKLDLSLFQPSCVTLLRRYIDGKEAFELECLRTIEHFLQELDYPRGIIGRLLEEVSDHDLIAKETILKWSQSRSPAPAIDAEIHSVLTNLCI